MKMAKVIAKASNGWVLYDMPLTKAVDCEFPEPVIIDREGRFVADFGAHEGSMANAQAVMTALGAPPPS